MHSLQSCLPTRSACLRQANGVRVFKCTTRGESEGEAERNSKKATALVSSLPCLPPSLIPLLLDSFLFFVGVRRIGRCHLSPLLAAGGAAPGARRALMTACHGGYKQLHKYLPGNCPARRAATVPHISMGHFSDTDSDNQMPPRRPFPCFLFDIYTQTPLPGMARLPPPMRSQ